MAIFLLNDTILVGKQRIDISFCLLSQNNQLQNIVICITNRSNSIQFIHLINSFHLLQHSFFFFSIEYFFHLIQETTLYGLTVKLHEPVGVVGIACPDENPLLSFISLFAPAVARGNVVVIIPSEKYPLVAMNMYQVSS